jgi:hypothetical protein
MLRYLACIGYRRFNANSANIFRLRYLILLSYTYIVSRDVRALMLDDLYTHLTALPNSHQTESVLNVSRRPENFTQHSLQQLLPPPNCTRNLTCTRLGSRVHLPIRCQSRSSQHRIATSRQRRKRSVTWPGVYPSVPILHRVPISTIEGETQEKNRPAHLLPSFDCDLRLSYPHGTSRPRRRPAYIHGGILPTQGPCLLIADA